MKYQDLCIRKCAEDDLHDILELQDKIFDGLEDESVLRRNSRENFEKCLCEPNCTLGLYDDDDMIGVIIIAVPASGMTDLHEDLERHEVRNPATFKLVMVKEDYRGHGLQKSLMWVLEKLAYIRGYEYLCVSVSPNNEFSRNNIAGSGYEYDHRGMMYNDLDREVYVKELHTDEYFSSMEKLARSLEGSRKSLAAVDMSRCLQGSFDIAATGDVLEYVDDKTGASSYGLYIKGVTDKVLIYDGAQKKWTIVDCDEEIGELELKRVWINTSPKLPELE